MYVFRNVCVRSKYRSFIGESTPIGTLYQMWFIITLCDLDAVIFGLVVNAELIANILLYFCSFVLYILTHTLLMCSYYQHLPTTHIIFFLYIMSIKSVPFYKNQSM